MRAPLCNGAYTDYRQVLDWDRESGNSYGELPGSGPVCTEFFYQFFDFILVAADEGERNDESFLQQHERGLMHCKLAEVLDKIAAHHRLGADEVFIRLVGDLEPFGCCQLG